MRSQTLISLDLLPHVGGRRRIRLPRAVVWAPAVAALVTAWLAIAGDAAARTYVPNCGNAYYLEFKPDYWSAGCTGGSANVIDVSWTKWGKHTARGAGTAQLRGPCDPSCPEAEHYEGRAKLRLFRTRSCREGRKKRLYFSRVRLAVYYEADNLFGYPEGWRTGTYKVDAYGGRCGLSRP